MARCLVGDAGQLTLLALQAARVLTDCLQAWQGPLRCGVPPPAVRLILSPTFSSAFQMKMLASLGIRVMPMS